VPRGKEVSVLRRRESTMRQGVAQRRPAPEPKFLDFSFLALGGFPVFLKE
jgi:hypothetical protein